jgi:FkbM family methyltransferase
MISSALAYLRLAPDVRSRATVVAYLLNRVAARFRDAGDSDIDWSVRLGDERVTFRPGNGELALYREIFLTRVYEAHPAFVPRPGWCVMDIGANIGLFSIRAARLIGSSGRLVSMEPDTETYKRLVINLQANGVRAATPLCAAVGSAAGAGRFLRGRQSTTGRLVNRHESDEGGVPCHVTTIDEVADDLGFDRIDLIKLDIEGGEIDALVGADAALRRCARVVTEFHGTRAPVHAMLAARGFHVVHEYGSTHGFFVNGQHAGERLDA